MKKMNCFKIIGSLGIILVTSACMDIRAVDKEDAGEGDSAPAKTLANSLNVEVLEQAEVGAYEVRFVDGGPRMTLRKTTGDESKTIVLGANGELPIDEDVISGKRYRYELLSATGAVIATAEVEIPLDLRLDEDFTVTKENNPFKAGKRYRRLGFASGVSLTTSGTDVVIQAERVYFERNTIQSWTEHDRSPSLDMKKDGGLIELRADQAVGEVHFALRGRHGENGPDQFGETADLSLKGRSGAKGAPARHETFWRSLDGTASNTRMARCVEQATDGATGEPGLRGWQGARGGRGGDAASLIVAVANREELRLTAQSRPGEGGAGGLGSPGGEGGEGGPAGERFHTELKNTPIPAIILHENCREARAGARGPQGERGLNGEFGERGREGTVCLKNLATGKCESP